MPFHTIVPRFSFADFWWAAADLIDAHPLLFGVLLVSALLVVWECGKIIGQEWEIRSVRRKYRNEVREIIARDVKRMPMRMDDRRRL